MFYPFCALSCCYNDHGSGYSPRLWLPSLSRVGFCAPAVDCLSSSGVECRLSTLIAEATLPATRELSGFNCPAPLPSTLSGLFSHPERIRVCCAGVLAKWFILQPTSVMDYILKELYYFPLTVLMWTSLSPLVVSSFSERVRRFSTVLSLQLPLFPLSHSTNHSRPFPFATSHAEA